ncbi:hypothetical protein H0H92_000391, partial [Tricholoma furcatifolium]
MVPPSFPVARHRAASSQAVIAAPQVPVAQPALRRSQLACFLPPAHLPPMFHEEGTPTHPVSANEMLDIGRRDFLRRALWQHYFVDQIPDPIWKRTGYTPLPNLHISEPLQDYPSPIPIPVMVLRGYFNLNNDLNALKRQ